MKMAFKLLTLLFTIATAARAQVAPEAAAGTAELQYSARYAQNAVFLGSNPGDSQNAILSGNVDYRNGVKHLPFALTYAGGYAWNIAGISYGDGLFENLLLTQRIVKRSWNIQASDDLSYRREAPTTGFSGVAGTGEPVGEPNPSPPSSQTILTLNTRTIDNVASGEFEHSLNYATALSVGGSSDLLRYPDGNGLDTDTQAANALLTRRLNARNSLSGQYLFSDYTYPGNNLPQAFGGWVANSALFGYQREWSRRIITSASIGPQRIESSNNAVMPSSTKVSGSVNIHDQLRFGSASLNYSHSASGGGGFLFGAEVDSATADFSRELERRLSIALTGGYSRTSALDNEGEINAKFGAAMATLRLSPSLTAFANYTAMDQSTSYALPANALIRLQQIISFGIGYSPREKHRDTR
jgi:hypothetical protein